MSLQITGTVFKTLPIESGEGNNGHWKKQNFVIETAGQYPQQVCFTAWTKLVEMSKNLKIGQEITVHFEPSSREYNERWYTELKAWRIDADSITTQPQQNTPQPPAQSQPAADMDDGDGLPF